jgi:hypothetical protein
MLRSLALAALLAAALLAAAPAAAATFVAPSVEELARSSEAVVRGRVVDVAPRAAAGGRIVTEVEVLVASAWKGTPDATVRFVVPGGSAGGLALLVDSAPTFEPGEEVVVFLSRTGAAWRVNGQSLGKFHVEGTEARSAIEGSRTLPGPVAAGERHVGAMPVGELERRVRGAR